MKTFMIGGARAEIQLGVHQTGSSSNRYLRTLLVVAAHAVLRHRKGQADALRSWASKLMKTKPFRLVAIALANKLARIVFAVLRSKTT